MRFTSTIPALVLMTVLQRHVRAQLVGCDTVKCPTGGCVVGNITNLDLGISSLSSDISPGHDLTWTVGSADTPHHNSINDTWLKSYLSRHPSRFGPRKHVWNIRLRSIFEAGTVIQFNVTAPETSIGTCQDALHADCVGDLLALATNSTVVLSSGSTSPNETYVCTQLQAALASNMPTSCQSKGLTAGPIVVKELTGSGSSLLHVQQGNCNISTGGSAYNIALAEEEFFRSDTYTSHVSAYIFGVTPVLTVFYPNIGPSTTSLLQQAEAHLNCLKIVEPGATDSYPGLLNDASSFGEPRPWLVVSALLLIAQLWF